MYDLDMKRLPRHVAIIMDGNGRWARQKLRTRIFGHEKGVGAVRKIVSRCREIGIPYLTLYAFSKENWNRPAREVKALWSLLERFLKAELPEMIEKQIRFLHLGDVEGIPASVLQILRQAEEQTAGFGRLVLSLALNYGGRQEILRAVQLLAEDVRNGRAIPSDLSGDVFSRYLYTEGYPDPDLVIRTGGEIRVSNFLLWQIAYAELYFTEILWPDFAESDFMEALVEFQNRERRFGRTGEQVKSAVPDRSAPGAGASRATRGSRARS
ncbi:MAG: isoprenyl transferase [Desulfobacteraceae bacterium]|nr:isoprenyl transferase [Desulfobacteraceae bacterium]